MRKMLATLAVIAITVLAIGLSWYGSQVIIPPTRTPIANTETPVIANTAPHTRLIVPTWAPPRPVMLATETPVLAIVASPLHVRSGPGIDYPVISYLEAGSQVVVLYCWHEWAQVRQGWVHAAFLEPEVCK